MLIFTISKKDLYWISLFLISYYGYIIAYNHKEIIIKPIHFIWLLRIVIYDLCFIMATLYHK